MLTPLPESLDASCGSSFAIVASRYNAAYVDSMLDACRSALEQAGAKHGDILAIRVPGAFEIPAVASRLASRTVDRPDVLIALGVILEGATAHAGHIGSAVSHALADIQVRYRIPVVHEVLLLRSEEQARRRCLQSDHNRGAEAAATALAMARTMRGLGPTL